MISIWAHQAESCLILPHKNHQGGRKRKKTLVLSPAVWYKWSVKKELQEYVGMRECLQVLLRALMKCKDKEGKTWEYLLGGLGKIKPAPVVPAGRVRGEHSWVRWEILKTVFFFYYLVDELWCGFIEVLDLCFPMTWWPYLLGNTGVGGQKMCRDSANTNPFPMPNFLGDG